MEDGRLKELAEIERHLSTLTDTSASLRLIVESAVQLTGAAGGAFWAGDPAAADSLATLVCAVGSASLTRNRLAADTESSPPRERWTDEERRRRISSVPAVTAGRQVGVLIVFHPDAPLGDASESLLVLMAARAASVVASGECLARLTARDEFLSTAAHQMRTPISILRLELQGLDRRLQGSPSELQDDRAYELRREVDRAVRQCDNLSRVSEHLLDLLELRTRQIRLDRGWTNLGAVAKEVAERLSDQLAHARCHLVMDLQPGAAGIWDRRRLTQVADALLMNAVKHAPGSLVELSVTANARAATLRVRDGGKGIARENVAHVFDGFERPAAAAPVGGWGLGLLLCRRIVEAHGGTIRIISAPGHGSEFVVDLPRGGPLDLRAMRAMHAPS